MLSAMVLMMDQHQFILKVFIQNHSGDYLKNKIVLHYSLYNCGYHVIIESKLVYLDTSNVFNIKNFKPRRGQLVVFLGEEILANPEIGFNFNQQYVDKINLIGIFLIREQDFRLNMIGF